MTAVYADTLTREAIIDAIKKRHCYATTGAKITVTFTVNNHNMGERLRLLPMEEINIDLNVKSPKNIIGVEVIKNNLAVHAFSCNDTIANLHWTDTSISSAGYYYLRVLLANNQMAFTSPIWFKREDHPPTAAVPVHPKENKVLYSQGRPIFYWNPSIDPDTSDLSYYLLECQKETDLGRIQCFGPFFTNWVAVDGIIPEANIGGE